MMSPVRPIEGADGYFATIEGVILSVRKNRNVSDPFDLLHELKPTIRRGWPRVKISSGKRGGKTTAVHVLVATAFHGSKPSALHETRHLDGTRDNNRPWNLKWDLHFENIQDMKRHGTRLIGENCPNAINTSENVALIKALIARGARTRQIAKVLGIHWALVQTVVSGKAWGYVEPSTDERKILSLEAALPPRNVYPDRRGELSRSAKLTVSKVIEIRRRLVAGESVSDIARDYKVVVMTICYVRDRKTWKHVP